MPTTKQVKCVNCGRMQDDLGRGSHGTGATCEFCGNSPLPTWSVKEGHWLHPEYKTEKEIKKEQQQQITDALKAKYRKRAVFKRRTKVPTLKM